MYVFNTVAIITLHIMILHGIIFVTPCIKILEYHLFQNSSVKWNMEFLDLVNKLVTQMSTADVVYLANKSCTLMSSDLHKITLFTPDFVNKLINCIYPFVFKVHLLPYMSWYDCSLLKQLVIFSANDKALRMIDHFTNSVDYSKSITSYPMPEFSQMMITLDESQYTLLATKHYKGVDALTLQDLLRIKKLLVQRFEITEYSIHLAGIRTAVCCFYWLLPKQVRSLVESKLTDGQLELWNEGCVVTKLLPDTFFSDEDNLHHIYDLFCVFDENLEDHPMEV